MPLQKRTLSADEDSSSSSLGSFDTLTNSPTPERTRCRRIEFLFPKDVPGLRDSKAFEKEASMVITELANCGSKK